VSLDEHKEDKIAQLICKAFGNGDSSSNNLGPARIIFRDCMLTETSIDLLQQLGALTESKTEVSINRRTGTSTGGLRQVERVPSGAEFRFEVIIKEIDDDKDSVLEIFKEGIKLLEMDCLGGSGSRGYGRVEFVDLKYIEENININENH
jgi:CRISPR-associated protein Csm3